MNITLDNNILDNFKLKNKNLLINDKFYLLLSGINEYRLYSYFSTMINNSIILDIGTYQGTSSISLSHNVTNMVYSYDITDHINGKIVKNNIVYLCKNFLEDKELIIKASLIVLDIKHNGKEEIEIYNKLKEYNFKGLLLVDDIHFNDRIPLGGIIKGYNMKRFWDYIDLPKWDLTKYGHSTGTGLVDFNNNIKSIQFN